MLRRGGRRAARTDTDTQRVSAAGRRAAPPSCPTVVRLLDDRHVAVDDIGLRRPTLDEVFLALTGQTLASDTDRRQSAATPPEPEAP